MACGRGGTGTSCAYPADVERSTKADRTAALLAAAAHDFNDDLTVILSAIADSLRALPLNHPAIHQMEEAQRAAGRCAKRTARMLGFSARQGFRPAAARVDALLAR